MIKEGKKYPAPGLTPEPSHSVVQSDGNLVLANPGGALWPSGTWISANQ
jgi:hypothetical protein